MSNHYIQHYQDLLDQLENKSLRRKLKVSQSPSAPVMTINGRSMLTFCSNDYLGLANHPALANALMDGARIYGAGSGASHMISGHSQAHDELEKALALSQASFIPCVKALFFSTGYMANMAAITGLSALSNTCMTIYQDTHALEQLLKEDQQAFKLIITDAVFSMDGDIAHLEDLLALAEKYNALLMVDDAHGFG